MALPALLLVLAAGVALQAPSAAAQNVTTCVPPNNANNTVCPHLVGVAHPSDMPDIEPLYVLLKADLCQGCHAGVDADFLCAMIYALYGDCAKNGTAGGAQDYACQEACDAINTQCNATHPNGTAFFPSATCAALPSKNGDVPCNKNNGNNICKGLPFLLRKTGGAPNWVWIFVVGIGGLLLILLILISVLFFLKREDFFDVINPCKWCECCPYYYDIDPY